MTNRDMKVVIAASAFNASHLASGIYFARMTANNELGKNIYKKTVKMLLVK